LNLINLIYSITKMNGLNLKLN